LRVCAAGGALRVERKSGRAHAADGASRGLSPAEGRVNPPVPTSGAVADSIISTGYELQLETKQRFCADPRRVEKIEAPDEIAVSPAKPWGMHRSQFHVAGAASVSRVALPQLCPFTHVDFLAPRQ